MKTDRKEVKFGLALGGGAAVGMAHIPVLQAFDDLGLKPAAITGTSVGALIGAAYAAGVSADALADHVRHLSKRPLWQVLRRSRGRALTFNRLLPALHAEAVARALLPEGCPYAFADLAIPFRAVAFDYHARALTALDQGALLPAVAASLAVPGLFKPVRLGGRVYVDGGIADNLPIAFLPPVDHVVAVNVFHDPKPLNARAPGQIRAGISGMRALIDQATRATAALNPPDTLILPPLHRFGPGAMGQLEAILDGAAPARVETRRRLEAVLADPVGVHAATLSG